MAEKRAGRNAGAGKPAVAEGLTPDRLVEEIRARAQEKYLKRGNAPGDAMSDWLAAEKEVKAAHGIRK